METHSDNPEVPASIHREASWGAIISIVVILAMIVIGAFYAWGQRIAEDQSVTTPAVQVEIATTTAATSTTTTK